MTTSQTPPINDGDGISVAMRHACDILRRDNNMGGLMAYTEHLAWLLFLRFLDLAERKREKDAAAKGETYQSVLPPDLRWNAWAGIDALSKWNSQQNELCAFVRTRLLPGLAGLSGTPLATTIRDLFSEEGAGNQIVVRNVPVCASDHNLKEVLAIINQIDFEQESTFFALTRFYEDLLARMGQENKIAGEFHTPRPIIRFMVEIIDPQIGETVYDPACGSAGFLAQAYLHMSKRAQSPEEISLLQTNTFYGQEKKGLVALLGTMNLVLHGVTAPNITRANTLEEPMLMLIPPSVRYDVILTNPPFGGHEGPHIQDLFPVRSNATELLFLQHVLRKLKPDSNARAGLVVPEGVLFRSGPFAEVKRMLLDDFHLFAVISLPPGAFAPYTDVKTALIFFRRAEISQLRNPLAREQTWYYELPLPEGMKKFSKRNPIQDTIFDEARELWTKWRAWIDGEGACPFPLGAALRANARTPQVPPHTWVETLSDLLARNCDLSARRPISTAHEHVPTPEELLEQMMANQREIQARMLRLRALLNKSNDAQNEWADNDMPRTYGR